MHTILPWYTVFPCVQHLCAASLNGGMPKHLGEKKHTEAPPGFHRVGLLLWGDRIRCCFTTHCDQSSTSFVDQSSTPIEVFIAGGSEDSAWAETVVNGGL